MRATSIATALLLLSLSHPGVAQQETCGLSKMTDTNAVVYPPIAKAAHVEGNVIMLVRFKLSGEVEKVDIVSGPEMLKPAATSYVQGWRANEYTGPRTCPIVISFRLLPEKDTTTPHVIRQDPQHVTLNLPAPRLETNYASIIQLPKTIELLYPPLDSNSIQQLYLVIRVGSLTYRP
jgi:hypothetical protein